MSDRPAGVLAVVQRFWFEPTDSVRLDTFRRLFALGFLAYLPSWSLHSAEWLTSHGFHYTAETNLPARADPWPLLPAWAVPWFWLGLVAVTAALVVGWRPRTFACLALSFAVYVQLADYLSEFTINKLYIVGFALLAVAPPVQRTGVGPPVSQSVWPVRILQITLLTLYSSSGVCKAIHGDWISQPDALSSFAQGIYRTEVAAFLLRVLPGFGWTALMYLTLAFELLAPVLFVFRKTRPLAIVFGLLLHAGIAVMFEGLVHFSLQMCIFYVLFVEAAHLHALRSWIRQGARLVARAPFSAVRES